jgi:hypothetical protein
MIDGVTEEEILGDLTTARDQDFYLPVTREDYGREVVAYRELRYSRDVFERLNRTPGVDQVYTNDGFTLYYVDSETPATTEDVERGCIERPCAARPDGAEPDVTTPLAEPMVRTSPS